MAGFWVSPRGKGCPVADRLARSGFSADDGSIEVSRIKEDALTMKVSESYSTRHLREHAFRCVPVQSEMELWRSTVSK
jgi:hypothetical protein